MIKTLTFFGLQQYALYFWVVLITLVLTITFLAGRSFGINGVQHELEAYKIQAAADIQAQTDRVAELIAEQKEKDDKQKKADAERAADFAKVKAEADKKARRETRKIEELTRTLDQYKDPACVVDSETFKILQDKAK